MTSNAARKRTVRAIAAREGISYTQALRQYMALEQRPDAVPDCLAGLSPEVRERARIFVERAAADGADQRPWYESLLTPSQAVADPANLGAAPAAPAAATSRDDTRDAVGRFLARLREHIAAAVPVAPLPQQGWVVRFRARSDFSQPLDLHVTPGGMVCWQSFWRGERFRIVGLSRAPEGRMSMLWQGYVEDREGLDRAVGMYPVISDADYNYATWDTEIAAIEPVDYTPTAPPVVANVLPYAGLAPFRFRCEEFLAALSDDDLAALEANNWVAEERLATLLVGGVIARRDEGAEKMCDSIDWAIDRDPDLEDAWPYVVFLDPAEIQAWRADVTLYPARWRRVRTGE